MTTPRSTRVLLADDHPALRVGVRSALEHAGIEVCAEVASADAAVTAALAERPDVCLLDVNMPGGGVSAARRISAALPDTAVVMLTVSRNDDDLFAALKAGAVGYLLKDMEAERLPAALTAVLRGEAALPRGLVMRLVDEFHDRGRHRLSRQGGAAVSLTSREWQVLEALRDGLTTKRVAQRLHVSPATVRTHIHHILRKLQVEDRESAVRLLDEGRPDL